MKITKLPSGTYRTVVYLGKDENGKKKFKSLTHTDKKKLQAMAASYVDLHRNVSNAKSFGTMAQAYIDARSAILSPSTIRGYKSMLKALKADFGPFCACTVDELQVQPVIDALARAGKTPKTINYKSYLEKSQQVFAKKIKKIPRLPTGPRGCFYTLSSLHLKAVKGLPNAPAVLLPSSSLNIVSCTQG